jgi:hypothetical protein
MKQARRSCVSQENLLLLWIPKMQRHLTKYMQTLNSPQNKIA